MSSATGDSFADVVREAVSMQRTPSIEARRRALDAFQFIGPAVLDSVDADATGVRSLTSEIRIAEHTDFRLHWAVDSTGLSGAVSPVVSVVVELQEANSSIGRRSEISQSGAFLFDGAVAVPYRLVIEASGNEWATPWHR